ncbi:MAG TPA: hypothetical protein VKX49_11040 [Bryobacteraceae bacterium]|nr:hypothetical protein [Bryobacteraceae bacterium]
MILRISFNFVEIVSKLAASVWRRQGAREKEQPFFLANPLAACQSMDATLAGIRT